MVHEQNGTISIVILCALFIYYPPLVLGYHRQSFELVYFLSSPKDSFIFLQQTIFWSIKEITYR